MDSKTQSGSAYLIVLGLLALVVLSLGAAVTLYQTSYAQRIFPGVRVDGLDLRGKSRREAMDLLEAHYRDYIQRPYVLTDAEQSWVASLEDLGVSVDVRTTVEQAYSVGRSGDFRDDIRARVELLLSGRSIAPELDFDEGRCAVYLGRLARDIDHTASNASLVISGLQVRVDTSRAGRELDIPATCERLRSQLGSGIQEALSLVVEEVNPPMLDVDMGRAQAEQILSGPVTLTFTERVPDPTNDLVLRESQRIFVLDQVALAGMLAIRQITTPEGGVDLDIGLDRELLESWVAGLTSQIDHPPREARFEFDPIAKTLIPIVMSQDGLALNVQDTADLIEAQVRTDEREVPLSVTVTPASVSVDRPDELGIREMLAKGETSFQGSSAERAQNIKTAAARFHGVVILPGQNFSFNSYLGSVSEAYGFEESWVIFGDRTVLGPGGGVCQVSTTCFRAAFFAGLPIVERWPHAYRVGWYEPPVGLDAAIFSPSVDLKFVNDTEHAILIQTKADADEGSLVFEFYGTPSGRSVEMEGPEVSDPIPAPDPVYELDSSLAPGAKILLERAHDGLDVTIYRLIRFSDGTVQREEFFSRFQPWPARYKVGPDVVGEEPSPEPSAASE